MAPEHDGRDPDHEQGQGQGQDNFRFVTHFFPFFLAVPFVVFICIRITVAGVR